MIIISCVSPELKKRAKTKKKTSGRDDDDDAYDFERIERRDEEEVDDDDHDDFPRRHRSRCLFVVRSSVGDDDISVVIDTNWRGLLSNVGR